jgi:hypothetical protein
MHIEQDEMLSVVKLLIDDGWIAPDFVDKGSLNPPRHTPERVLPVIIAKIEDVARGH